MTRYLLASPTSAPHQHREHQQEGEVGEGGEEYCSGAPLSHDGCESIEACCTTTQCRYLTDDGSSFYCNGIDCYAAAEELATYCEDQAGCAVAAPSRADGRGLGAFAVLAMATLVRGLARRRSRAARSDRA